MATKHPMTPEARRLRARLGEATRRYGQDHEETRVIREEWNGERWLSSVAVALGAERPVLTDEQKKRFAEMLSTHLDG